MTSPDAPLAIATDARGVARVTLNRPAQRNAFDAALVSSLHAGFESLAADRAVRVIELTGAGDAFCAGADLAHMQRLSSADSEANLADAMALAAMLATLEAIPKPTVARVNGVAMGGGVGLIACCDVAFSADAAVFSLSEVRLGLIPATIAPYVCAAIGVRRFRALALTGERFDARHALDIGLLHEVTPAATLDVAGERLIGELLAGGPRAQAEVKALLRDLRTMTSGEVLQRATAQRLARLRVSEEGQEGMRAFLARRAPAWRS